MQLKKDKTNDQVILMLLALSQLALGTAHLLPNLYHSFPEIFRFSSVAVVTHVVLNNKIYNKRLLKNCWVENLNKEKQQQLRGFTNSCFRNF